MDNNELFRRLTECDPIAELQAELEKELELPEDSRDYDKIAELTSTMAELTDCTPDDSAKELCIQAVRNELAVQQKKQRFSIVSRWLAAAAACLTVFVALNVYTMKTFGEDFFSAVVKLTQNGFSVDFSQNDQPPGGAVVTDAVTTGSNLSGGVPAVTNVTTVYSPTPEVTTADRPTNTTPVTTIGIAVTTAPATTENLAAGELNNLADEIDRILTGSGQYKLLIPDYDSDLSMTDHDYEKTSNSEDFYFTFGNSEKQLDFIIEIYKNRSDIPLNLVPSENSIMISFKNDFATVYMFEENSHITAMFVHDIAVYTIVGHNMTDTEMKDIALSYRGQN